jgi:hypothetical protein
VTCQLTYLQAALLGAISGVAAQIAIGLVLWLLKRGRR